MTLIASFRANYGAIILADSQETVKDLNGDDWKYSVLKLQPFTIKNSHFVIAGGGDGDKIDAFIECLKRRLEKSRTKKLTDFRALFERLVPRRPRLHFIVAAVINGEYEIWKSTIGTLLPIPNQAATLVGFASEMFQHVAANLCKQPMTQVQIIAAGIKVLELARNSAT